jgi:hypothetical protein
VPCPYSPDFYFETAAYLSAAGTVARIARTVAAGHAGFAGNRCITLSLPAGEFGEFTDSRAGSVVNRTSGERLQAVAVMPFRKSFPAVVVIVYSFFR